MISSSRKPSAAGDTAALLGLPKLTAVSLQDSGAAAASIGQISASATLRDVDLSGAEGCTDEVLAGLRSRGYEVALI